MVRSGPHLVFLCTCLVASSFIESASPFLGPLNTGTSEPDSLFFGMTNPALFANIDVFGALVDAVGGGAVTVVWIPADACPTSVPILLCKHALTISRTSGECKWFTHISLAQWLSTHTKDCSHFTIIARLQIHLLQIYINGFSMKKPNLRCSLFLDSLQSIRNPELQYSSNKVFQV